MSKISSNCVECGKKIPYGGKGRPRTRHEKCMTPRQRSQRKYMKSYMPKYFERPGNRAKHNKISRDYHKKKREESDDYKH